MSFALSAYPGEKEIHSPMSQQLLQDLLLLKVGDVPKLKGIGNFIIQTVSKILINFKKYLHAFSLFIIHR